jgi:tetratricopeptide (TPR) repeat protein
MYVLTGIAIEENNLAAALESAKKLVQHHPNDDAADDALERVGAAAAKAPNWPIVFDAYTLMRQRYPSSPFAAAATRVLAEAAFHTGRTNDARRDLEQVVAHAPTDGEAWIMLAQARNTSGDRPGALEAYRQAAKVTRVTEWTPALTLEHARLLAHAKQWPAARALFERLLKSGDPAVVLEASYSIGDTYRGEENLTAAAQFYMTAAYLAPESPFGRRSLLAAGQAFSALKQHDAAAKVYRQLLAQTNVPGDLAAAAQQGLAAVNGTGR